MRRDNALLPDDIAIIRSDSTALKSRAQLESTYQRFELAVAVNGQGWVQCDDFMFSLRLGEAVLVFPGQLRRYEAQSGEDAEWVLITFELENHDAIESLRNAPRILSSEELRHLCSLVFEYARADGDSGGPPELYFTLGRLLRSMVTAPRIESLQSCGTPAFGKSERDRLLEQVKEYAESQPGWGASIPDLAASVGCSPSHLRSKFRTLLGTSLGKYLRELKLSRAAELLRSSKLSLTEVVSETGFASLPSLSRAFTNTYGISPGAYRRQQSEGFHFATLRRKQSSRLASARLRAGGL